MNPIIDFIISMVFIFLMLSMIVSGLTEYWNSRIGKNSRSSLLFEALLKVFNDKQNRNFTEAIYRHPLVENSKPTDNDLPAYLDSKVVSQTLVEVIIKNQVPIQIQYDNHGRPRVKEPDLDSTDIFLTFKDSVRNLKPSDLKMMLLSFIHATNSIDEVRSKIEHWYNAYMDRVSGWYKRKMKVPLFITSFIVTVLVNGDIFRISKAVWTDEDLRIRLVDQAIQITSDSTFLHQMETMTIEEKKKYLDEIYVDLKLKNLPIGWISKHPDGKPGFSELIKYNWSKYIGLSTIIGWLLMAFALHLGAPFWFDTLVKFINIRGAGVKPNQS